SGSAAAADPEELYIDDEMTLTDYVNVAVNQVGDTTNKLVAPVYVNDEPVLALVDSGADTSCISKSLAERLQLPLQPCRGVLSYADGHSEPRSTTEVTIRCGSVSLS